MYINDRYSSGQMKQRVVNKNVNILTTVSVSSVHNSYCTFLPFLLVSGLFPGTRGYSKLWFLTSFTVSHDAAQKHLKSTEKVEQHRATVLKVVSHRNTEAVFLNDINFLSVYIGITEL